MISVKSVELFPVSYVILSLLQREMPSSFTVFLWFIFCSQFVFPGVITKFFMNSIY